MKMFIAALALGIASPSFAQAAPADPHAGHAAPASGGTNSSAPADHADHHKSGDCCDKKADGKMACCEKMKAADKKMDCCDKADGAHAAHKTGTK
jgi:hypothetical protein